MEEKMGDASYGAFQLSIKAGNDLLNIAADDAEQLFARADALFGEGTGKELVARFFTVALLTPIVTPTPATQSSTESSSTPPKSLPTDSRPTEKQIKFAKTLGIKDAELLTRRELSAEIDKRKK